MIAISAKDLSKKYRVYKKRSDRLLEWLSLSKKTYHKDLWVLRGINLDIEKGSSLGIIGMNGAGKSTLLKLLAGTLKPTQGELRVNGRVAALLELGTGFHPELTGEENILINGKLLGLTREELLERLPEIKAFSELGDFFYKPIRTYSSGMYVRLAFSLASSVDPDILIIDEALSVGDAYFQQKCLERIRAFQKKGVTILFVSHDPGAIKSLCDQVALLKDGEILAQGDPLSMLEAYNALLAMRDGSGKEYLLERKKTGKDEAHSFGNKKAEILEVSIKNHEKVSLVAFEAGSVCDIVVDVLFHDNIKAPVLGILIRDRMGYDIFGVNTYELLPHNLEFHPKDRERFIFRCTMNLGPGDYTITAAIHSKRTHEDDCYQWIDRVLTFKVLPRSEYAFLGVSFLDPKLNTHSLL